MTDFALRLRVVPLVFALYAACAFVVPPAFAQTRAAQSKSPGSALYHEAVVLMRNGRKYEVCVGKLREAVREEPDNAEFHLALGCALASRAVSVSDAARQVLAFPKKQADYKLACGVWEAAQNNPDHLLYGQIRPNPPAPPTTRDDNKLFAATPKEVRQTFEKYAQEALREWEAGVTGAQTHQEKAQAHFVAGWGKSLLRVGLFDLHVSEGTQKALSNAECVKEMKEAAALEPGNAVYWRGLGDILYDYYSGTANEIPYNAEAALAYKKSIALDKKNLDVWYLVYLLESKNDLSEAENALRYALRLDKGNAFLWYEMAYFLPHHFSGAMSGSPYELGTAADSLDAEQWLQVLTAIEQGNLTGRYQFVGNRPFVPLLLASAWHCCTKENNLPMYHFVTSDIYLLGVFSKNEEAAVKTKNKVLATRWSQAQIGRGKTVASDVLSGQASPVSGTAATGLRCLTARWSIAQGLSDLLDLQTPDAALANKTSPNQDKSVVLLDQWIKTYSEAHTRWEPPLSKTP